MDDKVYFEVEKANGELEKMELLSRFKIERFNRDYIIYKNCDNSDVHYYAASYESNDTDDFSRLSISFSIEEKEILVEVLGKIMRGDFANAGI